MTKRDFKMHELHYDFAIVGAGWLGEALALSLIGDQKTVIATCRTAEKKARLESSELSTLLYQLGDDVSEKTLKPLFQAQTLILNIAPGSMKQDIAHFIACMKGLIDQFMQTPRTQDHQPHIIFISTTSVYGEQVRTIIEDSVTDPITISAKAHVELEQYLHAQYQGQTTVLRLAGLVGANRHPVRHLVKKSPLASANKRVNLVDRRDVIAAIKAIGDKKVWGETLHLCSHEHPSRQDYYCWAAKKLGLQEPEFTDEKVEDVGKIIDSTLTCEKLGLTLICDSPYKILSDA
jgi:nucleoside-diphosphate-sugar epimerase